MAQSGAIKGTTSHSYIEVEVDWHTLWQDADSNTSGMRVEFWARRTNTGYQTWGTFDGGLWVNGENFPVNKQLTVTSSWVRIHVIDTWVNHWADGWRGVDMYAYGGISGTGWESTNCAGRAELDRLLAYPPSPASVVATRQSDSRIDIAINHGGVSARNPIDYTELEYRQIYPPSGWTRVLDTPGQITAFTKAAAPNTCYEFSAATWNSRGYSGWTNSALVYTTPGAPEALTAVKNPDLSVTLTWQNTASWTPETFEVLDGDTVVATVSELVWTDPNPDPARPHTYTVRAKQGALRSAPSNTANIQLLAAPLAPTGLTPSGGLALVGAVRLEWQHNPVDSTAQTAYTLRYRKTGTTSWTTTTGATDTHRDVTLAVGLYDWQVQTRGQHTTPSPWSAVATVQVVDAPTVTLTAPSTTLQSSVCVVSWTWQQPQQVPQGRWQTTLTNAAGAAIETLHGTGADTTCTFTTRLGDATTYTVSVVAGIAPIIAQVQRAFTTDFPPPATPTLTATWSEHTGGATVTVAPGTGAGSDTIRIDLDRSIDGGATWEPVAAELLSATLTDRETLSNGTTLYRATAWSDLPSAATTTVELVADSDAYWLSGGPGFELAARLPYNVEATISAGLERTHVQYEGRPKTVAYAGQHAIRKISASGAFLDPGVADMLGDPGMTAAALTRVAQTPYPVHMWRDPDGNRIYGVISNIEIGRPVPGGRSFSVSITETEQR